MCQCGTKKPNQPNGNAQVGNPIGVCPGKQSAVILMDELGLPIANKSVQVRLGGGAPQSLTTDSNGRICFMDAPGTTIEITVTDTHESKAGESTTTPSGHHFRYQGTGP
jgi:hypothetical protein